jgi:uncharacterized UBP type Zn finger protein
MKLDLSVNFANLIISPVGIKNVGNTCYFASIAQSYFTIERFRNEIFQLNLPETIQPGDKRLSEASLPLFTNSMHL